MSLWNFPEEGICRAVEDLLGYIFAHGETFCLLTPPSMADIEKSPHSFSPPKTLFSPLFSACFENPGSFIPHFSGISVGE